MTPWSHARSSALTFGGVPEDYIDIHDWFDETKQYTGDWTHRALRHHSAGVQWAIEKFGHTIMNSDERQVPVKMVAEQHVEEDCGFIPTPQDWLKQLTSGDKPPAWMVLPRTKTKEVDRRENARHSANALGAAPETS